MIVQCECELRLKQRENGFMAWVLEQHVREREKHIKECVDKFCAEKSCQPEEVRVFEFVSPDETCHAFWALLR